MYGRKISKNIDFLAFEAKTVLVMPKWNFFPRVSSLCYVGYVICIYSYLEGFFYKALLSLIIFSFFQSKLYINTYYKKKLALKDLFKSPECYQNEMKIFLFFSN